MIVPVDTADGLVEIDSTNGTYRITSDGVTSAWGPIPAAWTAWAQQQVAAYQKAQQIQSLKDTIAAGVATLNGLKSSADGDTSGAAATLAGQVTDARNSAATQKAAVAGFVPGATYQQSDLVAIRGALVDVLARLDGIYVALSATTQWRVGANGAVGTLASDLAFVAQVLTDAVTQQAGG